MRRSQDKGVVTLPSVVVRSFPGYCYSLEAAHLHCIPTYTSLCIEEDNFPLFERLFKQDLGQHRVCKLMHCMASNSIQTREELQATPPPLQAIAIFPAGTFAVVLQANNARKTAKCFDLLARSRSLPPRTLLVKQCPPS
jgi:hypothetical protein